MLYRVYLWQYVISEAAEVTEEVQATSASVAALEVMLQHRLRYVSYAWVVPADETLPAEEFVRLRCPSLRSVLFGH